MKTRWIACGFALSLALSCFAQEHDSLKKRVKTTTTVTPGPVTKSEAQATFKRLASVFKNVIHVKVVVPTLSGSSPVTRSEVIGILMSFYRSSEPAFVITPQPVKVDVARIVGENASVKKDVAYLIMKGCVGNYSTLATGNVKTLAVNEFGDDLGFFLSRISEMTHTPSSKWTPYLHK